MRDKGKEERREATGKNTTVPCCPSPHLSSLIPHPLIWILLGVISTGTPGCRRKEAPAVPRYVVRIESLLPLHPLWTQIQTLDSVGEVLDTAQITLPAMEWESRPLPPAFTTPEVIPADLARDRQRRIEADSRRYVQQLEEFLNQRAQDVLTRVERSERKAMEARLAEELVQRITALREANEKQAELLLSDIRRNEFRQVAFKSQLRTFKGQALQDAQIQHNQLETRIAALKKRREGFLADVRPQAEKEMEPRRQQALADLQEEMRQRREKSESAIAAALERARERQRAEAEAIQPLEQMAQSLDLPAASPLPPPIAPAPTAFQAAQPKVETAQNRQRADRNEQRQRLLAAIRKDTHNAVLQIAQQEGWQLTEAQTSGTSDHTDSVSRQLKAQWKPTAR